MKSLPLLLVRHGASRVVSCHTSDPRFRQTNTYVDLFAIERFDHCARTGGIGYKFRMIREAEFVLSKVKRRGKVFYGKRVSDSSRFRDALPEGLLCFEWVSAGELGLDEPGT